MYIQYKQHYIKTAKAENQEGRFYAADGYHAILNKLNKKSKTKKQKVDGKVDGRRKASGLLGVYMTSFWHISNVCISFIFSNVISGESAFYFIDYVCYFGSYPDPNQKRVGRATYPE